MKKLFHYFVCALNIIMCTITAISRKIRNCFFVFFRLIKCFFLLCKKTECPTPEHTLISYYPSAGKLSNTKGYKHKGTTYDLSVIIPMYNSEKYIEECLNSIISQVANYSYEIILVDDGSNDSTVSKVLPYLDKSNIKLIKQENSGQSVARNNALYQSRGKYIMFIDSDDILLPYAIESLMSTAIETGSDIVEGSIVRFYNTISEEMIKESEQKTSLECYSKNPRFVLTSYGYSVAKVYKRELWRTFRFPEGYIFEDVITKFILRRNAKRIAFIEDVVYGYRQNNQSSSHGSNQLKKLDSIWVLPKIFELCKQENIPRDDIFYLLSLNHIGLLNYITTKSQNTDIKFACFREMRNQLLSIQDCRPKRMPMMFKLLDKAIKENNFAAWQYISETILKYNMLKKWREMN